MGYCSTKTPNQLTMGQLIELLERSPGVMVQHGDPLSYRGFYEDVAIGQLDAPITALELSVVLSGYIGQTQKGYKGGGYLVTEGTAVWVAEYGSCGEAITGLSSNGFATEEWEF